MSHTIRNLVRMANDIAAFFRPYPEEQAVAGIQEHIVSFWTPGMREELLLYAADGGKGLDPRVVATIEMLRKAKAKSPIDKAVAGPAKGGQLASDAG